MLALSTGGAGGLSGCMYAEDCADERMCLAPPKSRCEVIEPGAGPVMDECGVFVRASAPDDAPRAGTRAEPFTSLQDAIAEARAVQPSSPDAAEGGPAGNAAPHEEEGKGAMGDAVPYRQFDGPDPLPPR
ncbi:hypothetical protein [Sorangium sp. So ce233]|uniref:hypothetical protein n=1 Tax=Sorangium sp. So ce233 TaxID=3133290 RepID=UPI003F61F713